MKYLQQIDTATGAQHIGQGVIHYSGETTDAVNDEIFVDGTTNSRHPVPENSVAVYSGEILAVETASGAFFSGSFRFNTYRAAGNTIVTKLTEVYDDAAQSALFSTTVDEAYTAENNELKLIVTTPAGTYLWKITITVSEMITA